MGDFSNRYIDNTKSRIFVTFAKKKVSFKPFVDSFSFSVSMEYEAAPSIGSNIYVDNKSITNHAGIDYKLGLTVVSTNVNEAIENHKNFQILARMMGSIEGNVKTPKILYLKFSNLISEKGAGGIKDPTANQIEISGAECVLKTLSYEPDMEVGFFEYNGIILAKSFKMSLDISLVPSGELSAPKRFRSGFWYGRSAPSVVNNENEDEGGPGAGGPGGEAPPSGGGGGGEAPPSGGGEGGPNGGGNNNGTSGYFGPIFRRVKKAFEEATGIPVPELPEFRTDEPPDQNPQPKPQAATKRDA